MRAVLIDPFASSVFEVEHDGTLENILALLQCEDIDVVFIAHDVSYELSCAYIDDMGALKPDQRCFAFKHPASPSPPIVIVGRALLLGTTDEGADAPLSVGLADIVGGVTFLPLDYDYTPPPMRILRF